MPEAQGLYTQGKDPTTKLTKRQTEVLRLAKGEGLDRPLLQMEIADRLGISRQRVREIIQTLIAKGFTFDEMQYPPKP
jgi:biotin operon repressor